MDKKMHKVTQEIEKAKKEIRTQPKKAEKVLKKAEKDNERLVKIDREIRDPKIEKYDKMMKAKK